MENLSSENSITYLLINVYEKLVGTYYVNLIHSIKKLISHNEQEVKSSACKKKIIIIHKNYNK